MPFLGNNHMNKTRRYLLRRVLFSIIFICLFMYLTGCGGSGSTGDTNMEDAPITEATITDTPITDAPAVPYNGMEEGLPQETVEVPDIDTEVKAVLNINKDISHQTIEGMGFFGAMDTWWENRFFDAEWIDTVLLDLGITMWRNEVYPFLNPACGVYSDPEKHTWCTGILDCCRSDFDRGITDLRPEEDDIDMAEYSWAHRNQDASWIIQKPVVEALWNRSAQLVKEGLLDVELRIILTAWTPPAEWKSNRSSKGGGVLLPEHYEDYGRWWVEVLDMYNAIGVPVYAVSLQNEPDFAQPYNSMRIPSWDYVEMIKAAVPIIKASYPNVLVFGAEGMLSHEHGGWGPWQQYHNHLIADPTAFALMDRFAVHGYSDGIHALNADRHKYYWGMEKTATKDTPNWMTETSGYFNHWPDLYGREFVPSTIMPGALNLARAIQSALLFGDISAWVFWQGHSYEGDNMHVLWSPNDTLPHNKYAVTQHFYRYLRPGTVRIGSGLTGTDSEFTLLATAYRNEAVGHYVMIFVNISAQDHIVDINGLDGLNFLYYITTEDDDVLFHLKYTDFEPEGILIPAYSVVTLVSN